MQYDFEEMKETFKSNGIDLEGTLTLPDVKNPSVILLLPGSGKVDRNENGKMLLRKLTTNNLKTIAHHLAENGFASYRYDKRGVGKSKANKEAGFHDLVKDSKAATQFLKNKKALDTENIFVLGHSEGGTLGLILASENLVKGFIGICSPISSLDEALVKQVEYIYRAKGKSQEESEKVGKAFSKLFDSMREKRDWSKVDPKQVKNSMSSVSKLNKLLPSFLVKKIFEKQFNPSWFVESFEYDFEEIASKVHKPTLIIYGERDYQVPIEEGEKLKEILEKNGNKDVELEIIPEMNHLLRPNPKEMTPKKSLKSIKKKEPDKRVLNNLTEWLNNKTTSK